MFNRKLYNIIHSIKEFIIKYIHFLTPIFVFFIYYTSYKYIFTNNILTDNFRSNIVNLSGVLAGFLFTNFSIYMSLPKNKFTSFLNSSGYMTIIYKVLFIGIVFLIISMLLGLFQLSLFWVTAIFLCGVSETIISVYYVYKILNLSNKSD